MTATLVTAGSQQGIDLTAKALIDPGDTVVVENPSYLAALQAFQAYEARFAVVGSDSEGMPPAPGADKDGPGSTH